MHIYQVGSDSIEIIDNGSDGVLLADFIEISSVFAGQVYKSDEFICTIMCRRDVAPTSEFMRTLTNALAKFNSTDFSVKPISFEKGFGTKTDGYYNLMRNTLHGTHAKTCIELMDNLYDFFALEPSELKTIKKCAPGNYRNGRSSKVTVFKDGQSDVSLIRHIQAPPFVTPGSNISTIIAPPVRTVLPRPIHTIPAQYIGMDECKSIKKKSRGTIYAKNIQVCSIFIGQMYRKDRYQGTIICRRGVGNHYTFEHNLNRIIREFYNSNGLTCHPRTIMAGTGTETRPYIKACKIDGTKLPNVAGTHAKTDEELIKNINNKFNIPKAELQSVSKIAPGMANQIVGYQITVDSRGKLTFGTEQYRPTSLSVAGPSGTVPSATVTSSSIPPGTVPLQIIGPLSPPAPGVLPTLNIVDEDFL